MLSVGRQSRWGSARGCCLENMSCDLSLFRPRNLLAQRAVCAEKHSAIFSIIHASRETICKLRNEVKNIEWIITVYIPGEQEDIFCKAFIISRSPAQCNALATSNCCINRHASSMKMASCMLFEIGLSLQAIENCHSPGCYYVGSYTSRPPNPNLLKLVFQSDKARLSHKSILEWWKEMWTCFQEFFQRGRTLF